MSAILFAWDQECERCNEPCGLRAITVRGRLCWRCRDALGDPPPPPPALDELARVHLQWARVKSR